MNASTALIYGTETEGDRECLSVAEVAPTSSTTVADGDAARCESRTEATSADDGARPECPCDAAGDVDANSGSGAVWWPDYESPDKPIEDFTTREVGIQGECLAARYLVRRGMEVIAQNWRCRSGEVDIVAREEDGEVALVEVKTRLNLDGDPQSMPELAVDGAKQRRYRKIALVYLMAHPEVQRMRFDVIAININGDHNAKLRHLVGTFTWDS